MKQQNIRLLGAIRELGYRQKDFAQIIGESPSKISEVINGRRNLDLGHQIRWAKALGKPVDAVFGDDR